MFEKFLQVPVLTSPQKGRELKGFLEVSQQLSGRLRMKGWVLFLPSICVMYKMLNMLYSRDAPHA